MSIVVGFTPSAQGRAALSAALREARRRKQDLVIAAHAYQDPENGRSSATEEQSLAVARDLVEGELPALRVVTSTAEDVGAFLVETSHREAATLIVIGLRRKSRIGKLNLGGAARRVLLGAACPVLAVKDVPSARLA